MGRKLVNPQQLHPSPGYTHVAVTTGKQMVFIAGQVALDASFNLVGEGDLRAQTVQAMRNLEIALLEAGGTWDDVVKRTIYTLQPQEFELVTEAIEEVTGTSAHPPQSIVGVSGFALDGLLVEIEAIASI